MNSINYSFATESDLLSIKKNLQELGLPFEDIDGHIKHFLVAKENDTIVASIGMEYLDQYALLRSLAVKENWRGKGIASELLVRLNTYAKQLHIKGFYLFTTTADQYFLKNGFAIMERDQLPDEIKGTQEFMLLCPSTATCMYKKIN